MTIICDHHHHRRSHHHWHVHDNGHQHHHDDPRSGPPAQAATCSRQALPPNQRNSFWMQGSNKVHRKRVSSAPARPLGATPMRSARRSVAAPAHAALPAGQPHCPQERGSARPRRSARRSVAAAKAAALNPGAGRRRRPPPSAAAPGGPCPAAAHGAPATTRATRRQPG